MADTVEDFGGEDYVVRRITGSSSRKTYTCPGCGGPIRPATPHVVAWRSDGLFGEALDDRRHWHTSCWQARARRGPTRR